ncbi:uncharacterized protein TrAtP1_011745 [Trichoderma atroviride]|uniref:uncharacterized protein n=1 Tax=Hypocrea atroviridis TaxID=63577 RepID=UPI00332C82A0|nr:hypothetical protein TrAtP1_011745 [Trichoderma atroviride]
MSRTIGLIDDPFFFDLEAAINIMIGLTVKSRLAGNPRWVTLDRHPDLGESVCWCGEEEEHFFGSCSDRLDPACKARPTVSPNASLSACPHPTYQVSFDHTCFCFQINGTMKLFHERFLRPRIEAILSPKYTFSQGDPVKELNNVQIKALENIVTIYNRRVHKTLLWAFADQKYEALARFVTDMQRNDIVSEADKMPTRIPWHIERVHAILGWHRRSFDDCVAELKSAMDEASRHRISSDKSVAARIVDGEVSFDG